MITAGQLAEALSCPSARADKWVDALNAAMEQFEINTPARVAAFIAQIGHESGRLLYVRELWGPTPQQEAYEGRADLGNVRPGDGFRYRGRGLIQVTGRANYKTCGAALGVDLEARPELLETPALAAKSAAWFWSIHSCNELADAGDFKGITHRINGGYNGLVQRLALMEQASAAIT